MKAFTRFLQKVDSIAPDPWYVDGVKQATGVYFLALSAEGKTATKRIVILE